MSARSTAGFVLSAPGRPTPVPIRLQAREVAVGIGRIGLLVRPPLVHVVTYRICLGLQCSDREVLEHGLETGMIKRFPHGEFIEVHQPLGGVDDHGHAVPLAA